MYYSYYFEEVKRHINDWRLIRSIINNDVGKTDGTKELKIDNAICTDSKNIADQFNNFLKNIGPKLALKVGHAITSHHDYLFNSVQCSTSMFMNLIGLSEIIKDLCMICFFG